VQGSAADAGLGLCSSWGPAATPGLWSGQVQVSCFHLPLALLCDNRSLPVQHCNSTPYCTALPSPPYRREAQEEGEFAEAFFLCAQCIRSMEELGEGLRVAQQVRQCVSV
jgi:hypothetical protein